jgi:hypothetical protein
VSNGNVLEALGFRVAVPPGWDVRILSASSGPAGTIDYPVLHAANFALPARREDFGGEFVAAMTPRQVFVALLGYGTDNAGTGLFATAGLPRPATADWFDPYQMQRPFPGKAGTQRFFSAEGRTFCLYAVVGSFAQRRPLVLTINQFLAGVTIQPITMPAVRHP